MAKTETKPMRFEDGLKRLEQIVDDLEKGDLPLEKSIELFEEGKKLSDFCKKKLDEAQFKVETLMKNEKGESKAVPFDETAGNSNEKSVRGSKPAKGDNDLPF